MKISLLFGLVLAMTAADFVAVEDVKEKKVEERGKISSSVSKRGNCWPCIWQALKCS